MLTLEMRETVDKQRLGFVATVSEPGEPHVSPKGTFVVVDERTLAFGDIRSPGTTNDLRHASAVEVNFVDPLRRKGSRARGVATVLGLETDGRRAHRPRFDRWGATADRVRHVVSIDVRFVGSLSSAAYDDGAREADLRAQWAAVLTAD